MSGARNFAAGYGLIAETEEEALILLDVWRLRERYEEMTDKCRTTSQEEVAAAIARDPYWRGRPKSVLAWAALSREGTLVPNSVREQSADVHLAYGECLLVRVLVTYMDETDPLTKALIALNTETRT